MGIARGTVESATDGAPFTCELCQRVGRLYCARCPWTPLAVPKPLQLGVKALIISHPKEPIHKSSCGALPLLSPDDVELLEWPKDGGKGKADHPSGTWLVFPREDAVDAMDVDWTSVTKLVLIDSRWKHAKSVA